MPQRGLVIKFDGIDGCGKTTLVKGLSHVFADRLRVVETREFGSDQDRVSQVSGQGKTVSRMLYELALVPELQFDDLERQISMALAARRQNRIVLPDLCKSHDLVLSDRSSLTSYAYGHMLGRDYEEFLAWALIPHLIEDYILWIDTDVSVAERRGAVGSVDAEENRKKDAVELKGRAFQLELKEKYEFLSINRSNVIRIDGNLEIEDLKKCASTYIDEIISMHYI